VVFLKFIQELNTPQIFYSSHRVRAYVDTTRNILSSLEKRWPYSFVPCNPEREKPAFCTV